MKRVSIGNRWLFYGIITALVAVLGVNSAPASSDPPASGDPTWDFEYLGQQWPSSSDGTPTETPEWTRATIGGSSASLKTEGSEAFIRIKSLTIGDEENEYYHYYSMGNPDYVADLSTGMTFECRARVSDTTEGLGFYAGGDPNCLVKLYFFGDPNAAGSPRYVALSGGGVGIPYEIDTTQWHTYRVITLGNTAYLYVDGDWENSVLGTKVGPGWAGIYDPRPRETVVREFRFGDFDGRRNLDPENVYGRLDVDYVRVYTSGAEGTLPAADADTPWPADPNWTFEYLGNEWVSLVQDPVTEWPIWDCFAGVNVWGSVPVIMDGETFYRLDTSASPYRYAFYDLHGLGTPVGTYPLAEDPCSIVFDGDMATGITMESRVRAYATTSAVLISITADEKYGYCVLNADENDPNGNFINLAGFGGQQSYYLNTFEWHSYRLVAHGEKVGLYIDGSQIPVLLMELGKPASGRQVRFGDTSPGALGFVDYDYIRIYEDGPAPPLPSDPIEYEPAQGVSLPRAENNVMKIVTGDTIPTVGRPDPPVTITAIAGDPADLAANFTYTTETTYISGDTLVITENGSVLDDETWYRVEPVGAWVGAFAYDVPTLRGDVDADNDVTMDDLVALNGVWLDTGSLGRLDLDGDDDVDNRDYSIFAGGWVNQGLGDPTPSLNFVKFDDNPILEPTNLHVWECNVRRKNSSSPYMMWHTNEKAKKAYIRLATNDDPNTPFTRQVGALGNDPNSSANFDSGETRHPSVMWRDGVWKMWYTGTCKSGGTGVQGRRIGLATSPNGTTWTKVGMVLGFNPADPNDDKSLAGQSVIYDPDESLYKMWYDSFDSDEYANMQRVTTKYAESADGINWTKVASLIGSFGANPEVLKVNDVYYMWYDSGSYTGFAVSLDGITWDASPENPVLQPISQDWDHYGTIMVSTWYEAPDDKLYLYYNGYESIAYPNNRIGGAESTFYPR